MKYKKGDKFIVEIGEELGAFYYCAKGLGLCHETWIDDLEPYDESAAYQRGLNDAWEAARKIVDSRNFTELSSVFDWNGGYTVSTPYSVIKNYTVSEALAIIRAYEEQREIHVGDEVTIKPNNKKGVVLECHVPDICNEDKYSVLCGNMTEFVIKNWITKTGRHFPEVAALMEKMKGETDESNRRGF